MYDTAEFDPKKYPPENWFLAYYGEQMDKVAFPIAKGDTEFLRCEWVEGGNLFEVGEIPLRVDGVSIGDLIEAEWIGGDPLPQFVRVSDKDGYKTIRFRLDDDWKKVKKSFEYFLKNFEFRQQDDLLVIAFYVVEDNLDDWTIDQIMEALDYLPARIEDTPDWIEIKNWNAERWKKINERNARIFDSMENGK